MTGTVLARGTRWGAALALVVVIAGCGERKPTEEERVRATLTAFSRATAAKDYEQLCDKLLAPSLVADLKKIGLPCEIALQQGLDHVRQPRLIIGTVSVDGRKAIAEVQTSAAGETPSKDSIELEHTGGGWRIASLATPSEPAPAP